MISHHLCLPGNHQRSRDRGCLIFATGQSKFANRPFYPELVEQISLPLPLGICLFSHEAIAYSIRDWEIREIIVRFALLDIKLFFFSLCLL